MGSDRQLPERAPQQDAPSATLPVLVQRRMTVGSHDDPFEHSADRLADVVVRSLRSPDCAPASQHAHPPPLPGVNRTVDPSRDTGQIGPGGGPLDTATETAISRARGRGNAIAPALRERLESGFGADFSPVRVHTDDESDRLNRHMQATAFTTGSDIFFRRGAYRPDEPSGQHLLAHELAHTLQQGSVQRTTIRRWNPFKRKAKISKPKSGHAMRPEEMGSALSAREVVEATDKEKQIRSDVAANKKRNQHLSPEELEKFDQDAEIALGPEAGPLSNPKLVAKHEAQRKALSGATLQPVLDDFSFDGAEITIGDDYTFTATQTLDWGGSPCFLFTGGAKKYVVLESETVAAAGWEKEDVDEPLFPVDDKGATRPPSPSDIKQGQLGDCYLEAAIAGLVASDPAFVKSMFGDYGTKVAVTLFDVDYSDPDKPTFARRQVVVEKSVAKSDGARLYDQGALWVSILEKAYAAAKFSGTKEQEPGVKSKASTSLDDINSGWSAHALMHLTGRPAGFSAITSGSGGKYDNAALPWSSSQISLWETEEALDGEGDYNSLVAFKLLSPKSGANRLTRATNLTDGFMTWAKKNATKFAALYDKAGAGPTSAATAYKGEIRLEDIRGLFDNGAKLYWPMFEDYLAKRFPGKRGSGRYTDAQDATWNEISTALAANKVVTLTSKEKVSRGPASGVGHSGGEAVSKGLVGNHVYTALDIKPKVDGAPGVRYVLVRNPWGKYGREYEESGEGASKTLGTKTVDQGTGESWLELSDITKRFRRVDIG